MTISAENVPSESKGPLDPLAWLLDLLDAGGVSGGWNTVLSRVVDTIDSLRLSLIHI